MKKNIFPAIAGILCICFSCNTPSSSTGGNDKDSTAQKNIAAYDSISSAFSTGDASKVDNFVADDFVDHSDHGDVKGKDSLKAMITQMHDMMKDMKSETVNEAASGDYVYGWMRYSGNSDGSMGMPKGPYDFTEIELVKFNNDGKATEHWAFMQPSDVMKMMGPQPGMNMGDSSKMKK